MVLFQETDRANGERLNAAGGSKASAETRPMVSEKVAVAAQAGIGAMLGDAPGRAVKRYRKKVRANRRRLSK